MMRPFELQETATFIGGHLIGTSSSYHSVCTDSRKIEPGQLFVALKGERFDGHDSISEVEAKGAVAAVTEKNVDTDLPLILVDDTAEALGLIGKLNRRLFDGQLLAMTGSVGKTSVKNMLNAILSHEADTWCTPSNQNNEVGVPLSLLALESKHEFAVIEMGARHQGDIAYLGALAEPNVVILLNARESHIGEFGSYEAIVETKGEILQNVAEGGVALINDDDPAAKLWREQYPEINIQGFSIENKCAAFFASDIELNAEQSRFTMCSADGAFDIVLPVAGKHMVVNAVATAAAALSIGVDSEVIQEGLASIAGSEVRQSRHAMSSQLSLIDDTYNASPSSVKAAIDVLVLHDSPRILVLGEMAELGETARQHHLDCARYARESGVDRFYVICPFGDEMAAVFGEHAAAFDCLEDLENALRDEAKGIILIKGSRMARLERLVDNLLREVSDAR